MKQVNFRIWPFTKLDTFRDSQPSVHGEINRYQNCIKAHITNILTGAKSGIKQALKRNWKVEIPNRRVTNIVTCRECNFLNGRKKHSYRRG